MLKRFIDFFMGLANNKGLTKPATPRTQSSSRTQQEVHNLTRQEIEFILAKLRSADYKGTEFEMFFNIFSKLTRELNK